MNTIRKCFSSPYRETLLILILTGTLAGYYLSLLYEYEFNQYVLLAIAILGSIVPLWDALHSIFRRAITIETFNAFALLVSFFTGEFSSAAFIALMLAFASYLDWRTESRASNAVEELLKLKPSKAFKENGNRVEEIPVDTVVTGDILVVKEGERIPVDGIIIYGESFIDEASLTGESKPVEKKVGDDVYSSTLSTSGVVKIRATKVGEDSTIDRMAKLVASAANSKSRVQRLADRFATLFLPLTIVAGVAIYFLTKDIKMTAAFFLVICADDIAVSIPLAVTASLGRAAKRGVIIKGGEWLEVLSKTTTLAFDKTGTLTYGEFALVEEKINYTGDRSKLWKLIASAEKFSEHPAGKALYKEAQNRIGDVPDPDHVVVVKGAGIRAEVGGDVIVLGNDQIGVATGVVVTPEITALREQSEMRLGATVMLVYLNGVYVGYLAIADKIREEAKSSMERLHALGVRTVMLTGDNAVVAEAVCKQLGIASFIAKMSPEGKLVEIEKLSKQGVLAMVGDGVNDAPALARANVGIAMGKGGTAVAVETANVVILTDQLDRIPEVIRLARRTTSVVNMDMFIWLATNALGIFLVLTGIAGPAIAAFYNFFTDFIPLLNSVRLFNGEKKADK